MDDYHAYKDNRSLTKRWQTVTLCGLSTGHLTSRPEKVSCPACKQVQAELALTDLIGGTDD